ncbi:hypothetical protein BV20DRAFT_1050911 [Pilatotrama ljubarskyi]|nr:hypothetical protein BV20DRAFT_1050911 [Pilatotrama ljubarskyi]
MISVHDLFCLMQETPGLSQSIGLDVAVQFIYLTSSMKSAIIEEQRPNFDPGRLLPHTLPQPVLDYVATKLAIAASQAQGLWRALGKVVWTHGSSFLAPNPSLQAHDDWDERSHLGFRMLYPPTNVCLQPDCGRTTLLRRNDGRRKVAVFTLDQGVCDAFSVHLYCRSCHSNFHHNYVVRKGKRTYYTGIPDVIQVSEHKFVERRVLELFSALSLFSWTSATNAASIYHHALSQLDVARHDNPHYRLRTEHIWDGFVIHALLKDARDRDYVLEVPQNCPQKERFTAAMQARNDFMNCSGQPEFLH